MSAKSSCPSPLHISPPCQSLSSHIPRAPRMARIISDSFFAAQGKDARLPSLNLDRASPTAPMQLDNVIFLLKDYLNSNEVLASAASSPKAGAALGPQRINEAKEEIAMSNHDRACSRDIFFLCCFSCDTNLYTQPEAYPYNIGT